MSTEKSHAASENTKYASKRNGLDAFRVCVSSAPSTSSHGSTGDDCDALGMCTFGVRSYVTILLMVELISQEQIYFFPSHWSLMLFWSFGCTSHNVWGQVGVPFSDGKLPCLLEDRFGDETVEEISCGAYHVAVFTSRNEVYIWEKGANGRLGHGDVED